MDPERDGYISLEEESTMSPQQGADNPKGEEPRWPRPAKEDRQSGWKKGYPKNPVFMDMDLPGITDTGADGNLVKRHACLPKAVYPLTCNNSTLPRIVPKRLVNYNHLLEALITRNSAKS